MTEFECFKIAQFDALNDRLSTYVLWVRDKANGEMVDFQRPTVSTLVDLLDKRYCELKPKRNYHDQTRTHKTTG